MSAQSDLSLLRPAPRRPYDLDTPSPSGAPTPENPSEPLQSPADSSDSVKRTKSAIALTSSTLFGIYDYTTDNDAQTPSTQLSRTPSVLNINDFDFTEPSRPTLPPNDIPPQTQMHKRARAQSIVTRERITQKNTRTAAALMVVRVVSLFVFGVAYGVIVTHLHHSKGFSAMSMGVGGCGARYLVQWGLSGVALGSLLPWLDGETVKSSREGGKIDWDPAVRGIGAFVGIAYAIRKLPWQSTLQVSLTLALINPFLWYLVDRTRAGFWFSAAVGIAGTAVLIQTNPEMIQAPEIVFPASSVNTSARIGGNLIAGWVPVESVGVWVWVCSVLFCFCVCFGNVGRRLASIEKRE